MTNSNNHTVENGTETSLEKPSVFGMILNPTEQFKKIRQKPVFLIALIIVTILSGIGMWMMMNGIDLSAEMGELEGVGEEEMVAIMMVTQIGYIIVGLVTPVITIVISSAILLIIAKIAQSDVSFKQLFSMITHVSIISSLGLVLNGLLIMVLKPGNADISFTSLNSIVNAEGALGGLLGSIEVFSIWMYVLIAIGLQVVAKFSKGLSWTLVVILFVISALITIVSVTIGSAVGV